MSKATAAKALRAAADLIESPGAWTKGELARNKEGRPVTSDDPTAVCWCAIGAVTRVCHAADYPGVVLENAFRALFEAGSLDSIVNFNDAQESAEPVAELMRKAADSLCA